MNEWGASSGLGTLPDGDLLHTPHPRQGGWNGGGYSLPVRRWKGGEGPTLLEPDLLAEVISPRLSPDFFRAGKPSVA